MNQLISYRYKVELIKAPCQLCAELNKNQSMCINGCFQNKVKLYPSTIFGEWCGEDNYVYDALGNKKEKKCNVVEYKNITTPNLTQIFFGK